MPFGLGPAELLIVLIIALLVVGPKRLPSAGRQLGSGMREFKDAVSGESRTGADAVGAVERDVR